jgi:hypothetical protein
VAGAIPLDVETEHSRNNCQNEADNDGVGEHDHILGPMAVQGETVA